MIDKEISKLSVPELLELIRVLTEEVELRAMQTAGNEEAQS